MRNLHKVHIDQKIPDNQSQNSEVQKNNNKMARVFQKFFTQDQQPMGGEQLQKQLEIKLEIKLPQAIQISFIIYQILNLSNSDQTYIHQQANKLGRYDIKKQQNPLHPHAMQAIHPMTTSLNKDKQICKCCGYVKQEQPIPLFTSFEYFPCVGISTYLFFQTIKNLIYLHILLFLLHGVYALITNLYCAGIFSQNLIKTVTIDNIISWVSLDSKIQATITYDDEKYDKLYLIQMWIGVCLVIFWSLFLFLIRYYERKYQVMIDKETVSAADFSIIIQNYPKHLTQQNLQQQLNKYAEQLQQQQQIFKIQKINLSVSTQILPQKQQEMYQLQEMNNRHLEMQEKFSDWLCQYDQSNGFPFSKAKRWSEYKKFLNLKKARKNKSRRIFRTLFKTKPKNQMTNDVDVTQNIDPNDPKSKQSPQKGKTIAVVTFKNSTSKDIIAKYNSIDLATSIRDFLTCNPKKNKFQLVDSYNYPVNDVNIYKAPQPEDIKWQNLSASNRQKLIRKSATYIATLILLSISFVLVYALSSYQANNSSNAYLGFVISTIISVVNFTIGILIRYLTIFQKDYTETGYQTSLAVKSIWAQLLNSIVVPIIVHYIIQSKNIYGVNGLSTDVIYLGITNSFLPPLTKLIDPYYRYVTLKSFYIRTNLKSRLLMEQIQFNKSQELMEFQTGYQYIYFINLYLFTSYFVTLQPSISIFAILGMFMMYWLQKYSLLNRMSRPVPGTDLINTTMSQMINLGPIFFAVGALSWSHILQVSKVEQSTASYYVPNILAGSLAALFFIFPFNVMFGKYLPNTLVTESLDYDENRAHLNSQYDRTNPATMQEAIKQFQSYLEQAFQKTKKQITISDQQSNHERQIFPKIQTNKKIPQTKKQQKSFLSINNQPIINQSFVRRKKQCIRNRIKLRSKLMENHFPGLLPESFSKQIPRITELQDENSKTHLDHDQDEQEQENEHEQNLFKKIDSENSSNGILDKKQLNEDTKKYNEEQDKQNIIQINVLKNQPIKIKKQKQSNPSKIDFDFKESFPYFRNQIQDQTPIQLRDDKYLNFFAKNRKIGSENKNTTDNRISDRYQCNPYNSVFK